MRLLLGAASCTIVVLGLLVWLFSGDSKEEPAATPAAGPKQKRPERPVMLRGEPLDPAARAEGEALLKRMRAYWKWMEEENERKIAKGELGCGTIPPGRFSKEWNWGLIELRLLALGYPEIAGSWALGEANAPQACSRERRRASEVLGCLLEARWSGIEPALIKLCRDSDPHVRHVALSWLDRVDPSGRYQDLFHELARERPSELTWFLGLRPDEKGRKLCEELLKDQTFHHSGQIGLERMELASAKDWEERAKTLILTARNFGGHEFFWGLALVRRHPPSWLAFVARQRLEKEKADGAFDVFRPGQSREPSCFADDLLVVLWELGAPLERPEQKYLAAHGYGCEPRRRLAEVLDLKRYGN